MDAAIGFYCRHLGFHEELHPATTFAMLSRGSLRLVLSAPGGRPGGGQAMPDGTVPEPGGWNRFSIEVDDLTGTVARLRAAGASLRNDIVTGVGGKQTLVEDPSRKPGRAVRTHASRGPAPRPGRVPRPRGDVPRATDRVGRIHPRRPRGRTEPGLPGRARCLAGDHPREGIRDLQVGTDVFVLTWLYRARRDVLATRPGDDPTGPERGVFSTRSPARPNPVGLLWRTQGRRPGASGCAAGADPAHLVGT
jgi:catechol 2,3-dioxygenase-like lactoylglutathione lyase family enzyme